jgi:hypothetical protein
MSSTLGISSRWRKVEEMAPMKYESNNIPVLAKGKERSKEKIHGN